MGIMIYEQSATNKKNLPQTCDKDFHYNPLFIRNHITYKLSAKQQLLLKTTVVHVFDSVGVIVPFISVSKL